MSRPFVPMTRIKPPPPESARYQLRSDVAPSLSPKWVKDGVRRRFVNVPGPLPAACRLRAGDLQPFRALQPHASAKGKEGVGVMEPGEDVHGDRSLGHGRSRFEVVKPAD